MIPLPPGPPPKRKPDVKMKSDTENEDKNKVEDTNVVKKDKDDNVEMDNVMKRLNADPDFQKLSKLEKFKRYKEEKEKEDEIEKVSDNDVDTSNHIDRMKSYNETKVNTPIDWNDPSELLNREAQGKSYKQHRANAKVSKNEMKRIKAKAMEKKKEKFSKWYYSDQELYERQQRQRGNI